MAETSTVTREEAWNTFVRTQGANGSFLVAFNAGWDAARVGGPAPEPARDEVLAKLAEIPPAGSEERDLWLEAARQHGFEETSGGEQVPEYDPPAYFATADEVLKLMSEARKQGQRDVLAAGPAAGDGWEPIETADPPLEDVTADLPDGARDGLGWAVCDISGEFAYHTWWIYKGGGVSKVTHWRRPITGPTSALAQREAARG